MTDTDYGALAAFHDQLHRAMAATILQTRQAGLRHEAFLLMMALRLKSSDGPATVGQLAETLRWNRPEVVEIVDDLVRRGFVDRTRDRADRRRFLITLTPAGEQWLTPLAKNVMNELAVSGPDLLRTTRVAVSHAAASVARTQPPARLDVSDFAWRAVGPAPI